MSKHIDYLEFRINQLEIALKLGFVITGDLYKDGKAAGYDMEKIL